jgi:hypothetical protein
MNTILFRFVMFPYHSPSMCQEVVDAAVIHSRERPFSCDMSNKLPHKTGRSLLCKGWRIFTLLSFSVTYQAQITNMDALHYARVVFTSAHLNKYTICEIETFIVVILTMSSRMSYRVLLYQCTHISKKPFSSFCPVPCHYLQTWRLDTAASRSIPLHHPLHPRSKGIIDYMLPAVQQT